MADPGPAGDAWIQRLLATPPEEMARYPGLRLVKENPVRTVWRVPREGLPAVYLKRFRVSLFPGALKYLVVPSRAKAEWDASRGLRAAGVPAAEVLGFTETKTSGFLVDAACVVQEFPDALELVPWMFKRWGREGPWTKEQAGERAALFARLGRLMRSIHDAGFLHPDLHGGNLLLAKDAPETAMCVIDLHSVRKGGGAGREGDLCTLLHSMLTATTAAERGAVLVAYGSGAPAAAAVEDAILAMERKRLASRTSCAKLFRPTGRFQVTGSGDLSLVHLRAWGSEPFLAAMAEHRRIAADSSSKDALKRGGRSTVTRVEVPGPGGTARLVVKETKVRGALDLLKNALRSPRAVAGWIGGNGLWHRHLDVAEPRALVVRGRWPLRRESFLVMEDVAAEGERFDLRALRLWGSGPLGPEAVLAKRDEVVRLGRLLGNLHARGIYHGDLKAVNVFVRRKHRRDSFCLVDYDRVEFSDGPVGLRRRVKNLAQLAASVGTYFTRCDRLRFYREYARAIRGAWEERPTVARLVAEACARKIVVRREPIE